MSYGWFVNLSGSPFFVDLKWNVKESHPFARSPKKGNIHMSNPYSKALGHPLDDDTLL